MEARNVFEDAHPFALHLRALRTQRRTRIGATPRDVKGRKPLTKPERDAILAKTAGRCHICGGAIEGAWEADHVFAHAQGGAHAIDNYLPAHPLCNNYRWYYGTEEFQWILKLGVWWRSQVEHEDPLASRLAERFVKYEGRRQARRRLRSEPPSEVPPSCRRSP
jgi:5-methylcytosine-specific restriction endonuclease McrA